jgi:restriction endonuclease S subunit
MNNWQTKKLGDIAEISGGGTPPTSNAGYFSGNIPWFTPSEITAGTVSVLNNSQRQITDEAMRFTKVAEQGTVLLSSRATIGNVGVVSNLSTYNQGIKGITPKEELNPWYLAYWLLANKKRLEKSSHGTTFKELSATALRRFDISIPPLSVQQQIVGRLDAIRKLQELNSKEIEKAEELFDSFLAISFKPQEGWKLYKLGELFTRIADAILPVSLGDELVNYIGLENIESNTGRLVNFKSTNARQIKSTKVKFQKNDTLFGKLRPYLNKVWYAQFDGICSTDIWVLRAKENTILDDLLPVVLRFPKVIEKSSSGMTGTNLPRVNSATFDRIEIELPPINIQQQIVLKPESIRKWKDSLQDNKCKLSELFESTLNKAMKGELVF